jgi:hypothetical protein
MTTSCHAKRVSVGTGSEKPMDGNTTPYEVCKLPLMYSVFCIVISRVVARTCHTRVAVEKDSKGQRVPAGTNYAHHVLFSRRTCTISVPDLYGVKGKRMKENIVECQFARHVSTLQGPVTQKRSCRHQGFSTEYVSALTGSGILR